MSTGRRFAREFAIARRIAGLSQLAVATRVRMSQARLSRIERRAVSPDINTAERLAAAVGYRLTVSLVPDAGVRLRDSGQLDLAEAIRRESHPSWKVRLEAPIGPPPDRRAGDMLFESRAEAALFEIERLLADFQAQFRTAQLKRAALAERLGRVVRLVIAVPDLPHARRLIAPHSALIRAALRSARVKLGPPSVRAHRLAEMPSCGCEPRGLGVARPPLEVAQRLRSGQRSRSGDHLAARGLILHGKPSSGAVSVIQWLARSGGRPVGRARGHRREG